MRPGLFNVVALSDKKNPAPDEAGAGFLSGSPLAVDRLKREGSGVARRLVRRGLEDGAGGRRRPSGPARGGPGRNFLLAFRRRLDEAAVALDCRKGAAVETVDVAPHLQLAGVVDESRLVGQVNPDWRRLQLNVVLDVAEHPLDPLRRPVLLRAHD